MAAGMEREKKIEEAEKPEVKLADFLAKLGMEPDFKPAEPEDSLGDSYAVWTRPWTKKRACLEYDSRGVLYFEILDMSQVEDGQLVGLDSKLRTVVLPYAKLAAGNLDTLAAKVAKKLAETFAEPREGEA